MKKLKKPQPKKLKSIRGEYWMGFYKNNPHISVFNDGFIDAGLAVILFLSKRDALKCLVDPVKVNMVEVKRNK